MIEDILKKFQNIQKLPTYEELKKAFSDDIFDEKILTEVEFKLTKTLNTPEDWERLKRRWRDRWLA
jgi:hypothetical protein